MLPCDAVCNDMETTLGVQGNLVGIKRRTALKGKLQVLV